MIPICTSWRGHKFEGRYSYKNPALQTLFTQTGSIKRMTGEFVESMRDQTYELDICVRCGATVEKPSD